MIVTTAKIYLHANWVHSLKEKRMVLNSIIGKVKHRFNVSISEIEDQDKHQSIVIGMAYVSNSATFSKNYIQKVIEFIENNTEALILKVEIDNY